jgi:hypothetical protein
MRVLFFLAFVAVGATALAIQAHSPAVSGCLMLRGGYDNDGGGGGGYGGNDAYGRCVTLGQTLLAPPPFPATTARIPDSNHARASSHV